MRILGISCYFHDAAAALLEDGRLIAAAEEERFSRRKHDASFPTRAIRFCLDTAGIDSRGLDRVVFFEKPFLKFERMFASVLASYPLSLDVFREAMLAWLGDKLWIKNRIVEELGVPASKVLFSEHHLSHAASAFFCSPFEEAAILTVDGVGEWATTSIAAGRGNDIHLIDEIRFPHSLGLLYSAFTGFLGFEVNEGEYKVMGMASYGDPRYRDEMDRFIRLRSDGGFELDLEWFTFQRSASAMLHPKVESILGPARRPEAPFIPGDTESRHFADIAASLQAVTEEAILALARRARIRTGLDKLCLAGGVAQNSAANFRLFREAGFEDIYIQPSPGDGGAALGAALFAWHLVEGRPRSFTMDRADWGTDAGEPDDAVVEAAARRLASGKTVGWVQGRFEWGPRALGHRSILADPRSAAMKDVVNRAIKFREPFRPFAPAVPAEDAGRYFDIDRPESSWPARFMQYVVPVRDAGIPAVTHVDGTARVQAVHASASPVFHRLLRRFGEITGVPVLLNTSLNRRGEPMAATAEDAVAIFEGSGLDTLVVGSRIVDKPG